MEPFSNIEIPGSSWNPSLARWEKDQPPTFSTWRSLEGAKCQKKTKKTHRDGDWNNPFFCSRSETLWHPEGPRPKLQVVDWEGGAPIFGGPWNFSWLYSQAQVSSDQKPVSVGGMKYYPVIYIYIYFLYIYIYTHLINHEFRIPSLTNQNSTVHVTGGFWL